MTLEAWNLVTSITIGVSMLMFGLWMRHIVNQQLKLKDATIEVKDAEIARMKSEAAPNIAQSYQTMRAHAEEMSGRVSGLQHKLETELRKAQMSDTLRPLFEQLCIVRGVLNSSEILRDHAAKLFNRNDKSKLPTIDEALTVILDSLNAMTEKANTGNTYVSEGLKKLAG
jgi:hypothetical protein